MTNDTDPTIAEILRGAALHDFDHRVTSGDTEHGVRIAGDEAAWSPGDRFRGWLQWAGMVDGERAIVHTVQLADRDPLPAGPRLVDVAHVVGLSLCCVERPRTVPEGTEGVPETEWYPIGPIQVGILIYRHKGKPYRHELRGSLTDLDAWWPRGLLAWRGAHMLHQARHPERYAAEEIYAV